MDTAGHAYLTGLKLLARRELAEAQIRQRLARRQFAPDDIEFAVDRLRRERALDDRRTAMACARTEARVRGRGRARVVRQIEALGISREVARAAVDEVFADIDEDVLIEQALDRRLRRGGSLADPATRQRAHRYLLGQGFDPGRIGSLLRRRVRTLTTDR